uniref:hypothetical protein n=1 Tax=Budvicia aquatica TaxID=82979 RepID=UPI000FDC0934|nr:hypothetical protein [Budvicia aquatica]
MTHAPCCYLASSISLRHGHSHPFDKPGKCTGPETFLGNRGTCNAVSHCGLYRVCGFASLYRNADTPGVAVV